VTEQRDEEGGGLTSPFKRVQQNKSLQVTSRAGGGRKVKAKVSRVRTLRKKERFTRKAR